jgi:hypothetical protein
MSGDDFFDGAYGVRVGGGWLAEMAGRFSPEELERQKRATEAEERRWELEREEVADAASERAWMALREGHEPHTPGQVLANHALGQDREDRRAAAKMHVPECGCSSCDSGTTEPAKPDWTVPPHLQGLDRLSLERKHREQAASAATTPATVADLKQLQGELSHTKAALSAVKTQTGKLTHVVGRILGK